MTRINLLFFLSAFQSENPKGAELQVEVLMYLLLRMCEGKQREHTHISLTNRAKLKYEVSTHWQPSISSRH